MVELPHYREIPYAIRKNPEKRWNYLRDLLSDGSEDNGSSEPETPTTRDISISVTDGENPVQGASVVIGEANKTTGSAGGCSFNGLTDGEKTITVTAEGFEDYTANITVSENNTNFPITLTRLTYYFNSYDSETKDNVWGTGAAKATGTVSGDYTEIEVLTNSVDGFEGNKYFIVSNAEPDGTTAYELYSDAGTTGTGIYVTISLTQP